MAEAIYEKLPAFSRYGKALKDQAIAMREGRLGMSEAEKRQRVAKSTEEAGRQVGAMQQDLSQQMMAAGPQWQGQYSQALGQLGEAAAGAGAGVRADVEERSAELAEARRKETMAALHAERDRTQGMIGSALGGILPDLPGVKSAGAEVKAGKVEGAPGAGMGAKALSLLKYAGLLCWVAREVIPKRWKDCRTYILFRAPRWFRVWYVRNGESVAKWLQANPWAKPLLWPLFRYFAWRGSQMARVNPRLIELQARLGFVQE